MVYASSKLTFLTAVTGELGISIAKKVITYHFFFPSNFFFFTIHFISFTLPGTPPPVLSLSLPFHFPIWGYKFLKLISTPLI